MSGEIPLNLISPAGWMPDYVGRRQSDGVVTASVDPATASDTYRAVAKSPVARAELSAIDNLQLEAAAQDGNLKLALLTLMRRVSPDFNQGEDARANLTRTKELITAYKKLREKSA